MSNLLKIKNIVKALAEEFGETTEGQGYIMILSMIEKDEKCKPDSIFDLRRALIKKLAEHQVVTDYINIEINVWNSRVEYKTFVVGTRVESGDPGTFIKKCFETIEAKAVEYIAKEAAEGKNKNIALS